MTWSVFASVNFQKKKLKKEYKTIESMSLCSLNNWTVISYFPVAILLHKLCSQFYIRLLIGFIAVLHFYAKLYFNVRELQLENWKILLVFFHIFITLQCEFSCSIWIRLLRILNNLSSLCFRKFARIVNGYDSGDST